MNFFDYFTDKKIWFLVISLVLNGLLLSLMGYLLWNNNKNPEVIDTNHQDIIASSKEITVDEKIYVDVKGEVKKPGVYEVKSSNIINDVINLAEGFTKKAYTNNINLSKKVSNELVIYVYSKNEYAELSKPKVIIEECICPEYDISECINTGASEIKTENKEHESNANINVEVNKPVANENISKEEQKNENINPDVKEENKLININTAPKDVLLTLNGIGESKANAIIEYRKHNAFQKIEDIKNVSGIGDSVFEKIKENITV